MSLALITSLVGLLSLGVGLTLLAPLAVSLYYGESDWVAFLGGAVICLVLGGALYWLFRNEETREIRAREGIAIVGISWAAAGLLGGIPFLLSGYFPSFTDAVFESVSGFTTTGASVLTDIEGASHGVLFWRALTHWLGGMGFIVLSLAILPFVGLGGMQLFKAEVPSPTPDRLQPRITDTAKALWKVYALLTLAETVLLMLGGLDWFHAVCQAFATMATGGFSTMNASVAGFQSAYVEWVVTIFMVLAGVNFTLHYLAFRGAPLALWRDEECRSYLALFGVATVGITVALTLMADRGLWEALRQAAFQTATILTTTGFATEDYTLWPPLAMAFLLPLMFVGGSAGSTGGGPKVMRVMVVIKQSMGEARRLFHSRVVAPVKLSGRTVEPAVVGSIWSFMGLYLATFVVVGIILAAFGLGLKESFSASIACLGNIGPGLGEVGPVGNYAALPAGAKWVLSLAMIVGRLELYTVLVLFLPDFWRD